MRQRLYRARHPELRAKWSKQSLENNFLRLYGITTAQRDELLAKQSWLCAACGTDTPKGCNGIGWHVDHDHKTGKVRAILCGMCNLALGCVVDNKEVLGKLISYLDKQHA